MQPAYRDDPDKEAVPGDDPQTSRRIPPSRSKHSRVCLIAIARSSERSVLPDAPPQASLAARQTVTALYDSAAQMSVAVPLVDFSLNTPLTSTVYSTRPT